MPPQISDDERSASEVSEEQAPVRPEKTEKKAKGRSKASPAEEASVKVESDNEEEDDDEEIGEDEYAVEKITNHLVDADSGELLFEVKWEGFEKKSDRTWEPEENLESAPDVLNAYLSLHGGKEQLVQDFQDKKTGKGKKRGRASTIIKEENGAKRGRKSNGTHPLDATPPKGAEFKPPSGTWEEDVVGIDACEGTEGSVVVYLTWKSGHKSQHPLAQVYKRCPQQMLKFYESHLVFKRNEETS